MALPQFPVLAGKTWDIKKNTVWSTRKLTARSGVEYRAPNWSYPRWQFDLAFSVLRTQVAFQEYQALQGFINSLNGMYSTFGYDDPFDDTVTAQLIGTGDGVTTNFPLVRALGGYVEPILYASMITNIFVNAAIVATPAVWSPAQNGAYGTDSVTFVTAPAMGAAITASFKFWFPCSFSADDTEFNNFMANRWEVQSLKFMSVK